MHRSSFGSAFPDSGGRSPYLFAQPTSERSLSGLYEYLGDYEDADAPDVVYVRHLNDAWPEHFPPYSIAEGGTLAKHLRERVAAQLRYDPSRVMLIYKDTELRSDDQSLKHYGVKQNSEVVVRTISNPRDFRREGHSDGENERSTSDRRRHQDSLQAGEADSSTIHRRPSHRREDRQRRPTNNYPDQERLAQPRQDPRYNGSRPSQTNHSVPSQHHTPSRGSSPAQPQQTRSGHNSPTAHSPRIPAATPTQSSGSALAQPPLTATANGNLDPSTPMGQIQAIAHEFHTDWLKRADTFLARPGDRDNQAKQYALLTEMITQKVFGKGDQIDTDCLTGREKDEVRAVRRAVYAEANDLQKKLDRYKPS